MADAEPNLDIGLDYTGGIAAPTLADVGRYARVALDNVGEPNFEYVDGVERRVAFFSSLPTLTGSTTKTVAGNVFTIPALKATDGAKVRIRVRALLEFPITIGTKIGIDLVGNAVTTPADQVTTTVASPSASTPTVYEFILFPAGTALQRSESQLRVSGVSAIVNTSSLAADMAFDQQMQLFGQLASAGNSIVYRRIEVYAIGL